MTIAEIREYYRTAPDKEQAIKDLIISENKSEKLIRCYVHEIASLKPIETVTPIEVKKGRGRPAKNPDAVKPAKKSPVKARPVDKVIPMLNKVPKPVINASQIVATISGPVADESKESPVQYTHFEPFITPEQLDQIKAKVLAQSVKNVEPEHKEPPSRGLEPRRYWDLTRKDNIRKAIIGQLQDNCELPVEWVEEWNERVRV